MPGGPTKRSIGPLVDDEQGLERRGGGEGFVKGMGTSLEDGTCEAGLPTSIGATVSACLADSSAVAVIAAASRASLSAVSSFKQTIQ